MKKWFSITALFLLSYLIFIVATLPATLLVNYINIPKGFTLSGLSGSIWQAHIKTLAIATTNQQDHIIVHNVRLKVIPTSVITLQPSIKLDFGGKLLEGPQGELTLTNLLSQPAITDANIQLSATEISQRLNLPIEVQAFGRVQLTLAQFTLGKPLCSLAQGHLIWQRAALNAFDQTVELGDLTAKINCEQGALAIKIDPKNKLGLTFTTYIRSSKQISGNGYLTPNSRLPKALQDLLPFLGKPDNKGRYRLRF